MESIGLVDVLQHVRPGAVVAMKLDIKGGEWDVLPHLMQKGMLCKRCIAGAMIESHKLSLSKTEGRQDTVLSVVLGTGVGIGQPQDNLRTCPNYYERILTGQG